MVALNISEQESHSLANIIGCKLTNLPISYLGMPLHWKGLTSMDWDVIIYKIETNLEGWKGK